MTRKKKFTKKDVQEKMKQLHVIGYSTMGQFTPDEQMKHLEFIETRLNAQEKHRDELISGSERHSSPAS